MNYKTVAVGMVFSITACDNADGQTVTSEDMMWNGQPLSVTLNHMENKLNDLSKNMTVEDALNDKHERLKKTISDLEIRILTLEESLKAVIDSGAMKSTMALYDPRQTTLSSTNVQDAITELEKRVSKVEGQVLDDRGDPGPGLFNNPMDTNRRTKGFQNRPGGQNGQKGPGGPPPGGRNGQNGGGGAQKGPDGGKGGMNNQGGGQGGMNGPSGGGKGGQGGKNGSGGGGNNSQGGPGGGGRR